MSVIKIWNQYNDWLFKINFSFLRSKQSTDISSVLFIDWFEKNMNVLQVQCIFWYATHFWVQNEKYFSSLFKPLYNMRYIVLLANQIFHLVTWAINCNNIVRLTFYWFFSILHYFIESSLDLEPVIDDLKGDLKETFETYNELFYSCQDKIQKQNELSQVSLYFFLLYNKHNKLRIRSVSKVFGHTVLLF